MSESRRLRAFKRWMRSHGVVCSDALSLARDDAGGIWVRSLTHLRAGDLVATIPKRACLTAKTSSARPLIESAALDGYLGLSLAVMYERSLGPGSPWAAYLHLLPEMECVPLVWTLDEVDALLAGTELHKVVKTDKSLVYEDWKECILPLIESGTLKLDPKHFGPEQYFYAKSLVASRSFQIDGFHGFGMVPLADLFNHKTGAENVHFTSTTSNLNTDMIQEDAAQGDTPHEFSFEEDDLISRTGVRNWDDETSILEMIIVRDVEAGLEVFNTYGSMGNAALLHRYGFTEPDNPFDIINIDLDVMLQWSNSSFSNRYTRSRISLWRKLGCSGYSSQNLEYFEISSNGEPQLELLILLHIMFLPHEEYEQLCCASPSETGQQKTIILMNSIKGLPNEKAQEGKLKKLLLTTKVGEALVSLADIRESFYGSNAFKQDVDTLTCLCPITERKRYHSLRLRVSERIILQKLRRYASRC